MYESHFGFSGQPFQLNPDPSFYFNSKGHGHALAYLQYGVAQGEGFIVVTGEIGAGKTTLVRTMLEQLDPQQVLAAQIVSTQLESGDLIEAIITAFGVPIQGGGTKVHLIGTLEAFLTALAAQGRRALLVVDEAQNLSLKAIEELRMLSNFQLGNHALLQSFLVGQPELRKLLESPSMEQFRQRVMASCHLGPLSLEEAQAYIEHRLKRVGWVDRPHIGEAAFDQIYAWSAGVPRRINRLCNRLLLAAFLEGREDISPELVETTAGELRNEIGEKSFEPVPIPPRKTAAASAAAPVVPAPAPQPAPPPAVPAAPRVAEVAPASAPESAVSVVAAPVSAPAVASPVVVTKTVSGVPVSPSPHAPEPVVPAAKAVMAPEVVEALQPDVLEDVLAEMAEDQSATVVDLVPVRAGSSEPAQVVPVSVPAPVISIRAVPERDRIPDWVQRATSLQDLIQAAAARALPLDSVVYDVVRVENLLRRAGRGVLLCLADTCSAALNLAVVARAWAERPGAPRMLLVNPGVQVQAWPWENMESILPTLEIGLHLGVPSSAPFESVAPLLFERFGHVIDEFAPMGVLSLGSSDALLACTLLANKRGLPLVRLDVGGTPGQINEGMLDQLSELVFVSAEAGSTHAGVPASRMRQVPGGLVTDLCRIIEPFMTTAYGACLRHKLPMFLGPRWSAVEEDEHPYAVVALSHDYQRHPPIDVIAGVLARVTAPRKVIWLVDAAGRQAITQWMESQPALAPRLFVIDPEISTKDLRGSLYALYDSAHVLCCEVRSLPDQFSLVRGAVGLVTLPGHLLSEAAALLGIPRQHWLPGGRLASADAARSGEAIRTWDAEVLDEVLHQWAGRGYPAEMPSFRHLRGSGAAPVVAEALAGWLESHQAQQAA